MRTGKAISTKKVMGSGKNILNWKDHKDSNEIEQQARIDQTDRNGYRWFSTFTVDYSFESLVPNLQRYYFSESIALDEVKAWQEIISETINSSLLATNKGAYEVIQLGEFQIKTEEVKLVFRPEADIKIYTVDVVSSTNFAKIYSSMFVDRERSIQEAKELVRLQTSG